MTEKLKLLTADRDVEDLKRINADLAPAGWKVDDLYLSRNGAFIVYDLLREDGARTDAVLNLVRTFSDESPEVVPILWAACDNYDRVKPRKNSV